MRQSVYELLTFIYITLIILFFTYFGMFLFGQYGVALGVGVLQTMYWMIMLVTLSIFQDIEIGEATFELKGQNLVLLCSLLAISFVQISIFIAQIINQSVLKDQEFLIIQNDKGIPRLINLIYYGFCGLYGLWNVVLYIHILRKAKRDYYHIGSYESEQPTRFLLDKHEECSICLDIFDKTKKIIKLKCQHHFHSDCIRKWFHIKHTDIQQINNSVPCPLCKQQI